jgi:protein gp37
MADHTKIEWTEATWNPITGCSVISPGCTNCYAMELAGTRLADHPSRAGLTQDSKAGPVWTGEVRFNEQWLDQPLRWKRPRMIFVCAHGDLFHESVPDAWIDRVFAVMALCPQHTFQVLTKRADRMRVYMTTGRHVEIQMQTRSLGLHELKRRERMQGLVYRGALLPLPNVWLGVSVEDQQRADERIPDLLATPAAIRWISAEPLLGPINITDAMFACEERLLDDLTATIDWVVAGGESGKGARPMHPDWARSLRDQCAAADAPFFFKQWGEWADWGQLGFTQWRNATPQRPSYKGPIVGTFHGGDTHFGGPWATQHRLETIFARVGKKRAGRLLDGVEHNGMPGHA